MQNAPVLNEFVPSSIAHNYRKKKKKPIEINGKQSNITSNNNTINNSKNNSGV